MDDSTQQFEVDEMMYLEDDSYLDQTRENPTIKLFEYLRYALPEITIPEFERLLKGFTQDKNAVNFYLMLFIMAHAQNVFLDGFDSYGFRIFCNSIQDMVENDIKSSRAPLTKGQHLMIHYINSLTMNDVIGDLEMAGSLYNRFQQTLTELSNKQSIN